MTKKHFIALADCMRRLKPVGLIEDKGQALAAHAQWKDTVQALADFCQSQNSQFNRSWWLAYIAGECGPNGGAR